MSETINRLLDFEPALVSQITAVGHTYDQEIKMLDSDRDGISDSLLASTHDAALFGAADSEHEFLYGEIDATNVPGSGVLQLKNVILYPKIGGETPVGSLSIWYNETTRFGLVGLDEQLTDPAPIDPSTLATDDQVRVLFYLYKNAEGDDPKLWAEIVAKY